MTFFKTQNKLFTLSAALMAVSFAPSAFAQQECGDTTCDVGFECVTYDLPCPEIDCADGEDCRKCEDSEGSYCQPAECESDSECGDYMVCATFQNFSCPPVDEPTCDPDGPCEEPEFDRDDCETEDFRQCAAPWDLECETASDCGDGFECIPYENCTCSGSTGSGGAASSGSAGAGGAAGTEAAEPAPERAEGDEASTSLLVPAEGCECESADTGWCEIVPVECEEDSDCAENWTCQDNPYGVCTGDADGNIECTADPEMICMPPGRDVFIALPLAADGDIAAVSGAAGTGVSEGEPESLPPVAQAAGEAPSGDVDEDADPVSEEGEGGNLEDAIRDLPEADESAQSGAIDEDDATPEVAEVNEDNGDDLEEPSAGSSSSGGGCTVAASGPGSTDLMAMLVALGAAFGFRRRRASK